MKEEEEEEQPAGSLLNLGAMANEMIGKRRLTIEQVRSLERSFEVENKLEPERKMQLAKELALRPRQVAVWFQNRRARWKTKQLERDFEALAADYARLKKDYDKILNEKTQLKADVQRASPPGATDNAATCSEVLLLPPSVQHCKVDDHGALSGSTSSDVMDADSPRTTDHSSHCCCEDQNSNLFLANAVSETLTSMAKLEDRRLETLKLEDRRSGGTDHGLEDRRLGGSDHGLEDRRVGTGDGFHDEFGDQSECDYLLLQLDEPQSELPWWDWP